MKVVAIIQARMDSHRLPDKIMLNLGGISVLQRVIEVAKSADQIDQVIVATTNASHDTKIELLCAKLEVPCFRGSTDNVLDRFYQCAKYYKADIIVRIPADQPFLDKAILDMSVLRYLKSHTRRLENNEIYLGCDIFSTRYYPILPRGTDCEVFSFDILKEMWSKATSKYDKEHVTPYGLRHYKINGFGQCSGQFYRPEINLTLDTYSDMLAYLRLFDALTKEFTLKDVIDLIDKRPQLLYNRSKSEYKVIYLITSSHKYGLGHYHSSKAIDDALKKELAITSEFRILKEGKSKEAIKDFAKIKPDLVVVNIDARYKFPGLDKLAEKYKVMLFDHMGIGDFGEALWFNRSILPTSIPKNPKTYYYQGLEYFPVKVKRKETHNSKLKHILVTLGGSDPKNLTQRVLDSIPRKYQVTVVLGPMYRHKLTPRKDVQVIRGKENTNINNLMLKNDILICNCGLTAYTACAVGIPAIVVPQNPIEALTAKYFDQMGMVIYPTGKIYGAIDGLEQKFIREQFSRKQHEYFDNKGGKRLAQIIALYLSKL
jgi:spore coat polysaccharide biosynthesis protein SpsF